MQPSAMARLGTVTRLGAEGALCLGCRGLAGAGGQPELSSQVRVMDNCCHWPFHPDRLVQSCEKVMCH